MLIYWTLFACFALGSLQESSYRPGTSRVGPLFFLSACGLAAIIGFRYRVGGDWLPYLDVFDFSRHLTFFEALGVGDPGYEVINWVVSQLGAEIWLVNLTCAVIFTWGLVQFARVQTDPWLTMLVAIPYLVIVVAMGYTRQGVSIGIIMAGMAAQIRGGSVLRLAVYVAVAALFHKTAVVVLPLVALASRRTGLINLLVALCISFVLYDVFLQSSVSDYMRDYVGQAYNSQGAGVRIAMSVCAAVLFLAKRRQFNFTDQQLQVWTNFSLAALVCLIILLSSPSSTAVDRIALYTIPLQLIVIPRVPSVYMTRNRGTVVVIAYCFLVQFVYFNYALYARAWVPYRFWSSDPGGSQQPGSYGAKESAQ